MIVTVEIVARIEIPDSTPLNRVLVDKNLAIPLIVGPTQPGNGWRFEGDVLTIQHRVTEGNFWLHPEPHERTLP